MRGGDPGLAGGCVIARDVRIPGCAHNKIPGCVCPGMCACACIGVCAWQPGDRCRSVGHIHGNDPYTGTIKDRSIDRSFISWNIDYMNSIPSFVSMVTDSCDNSTFNSKAKALTLSYAMVESISWNDCKIVTFSVINP